MDSPQGSAEVKGQQPPAELGGWFSLPRWKYYYKHFGLLDFVFVILIGFLALVINQLEPYHKPLSVLQLQDPNINLPFRTSIVSNPLLSFCSIVIPSLCMLAIFPFRHRQAGAFVELRLTAIAFATCILINNLATSFGKKYVGRPRPNFVEYTGYVNGTYAQEHNKRDAFQSFPSGHASASMAGLGFLSLYLYYNLYLYWRLGSQEGGGILSREDGLLASESEVYRRRKLKDVKYGAHNNQLPLMMLLTLPVWLAMFIGMSRIRDHHHNYDDVVAGMVLGGSVAVWSFRSLYLGRRHEWLAVSEAAFQRALQAEREEKERDLEKQEAARNGRRPQMELTSLTAPRTPSGAVEGHSHERGIPQQQQQQQVGRAMHIPGASPTSPMEQEGKQQATRGFDPAGL